MFSNHRSVDLLNEIIKSESLLTSLPHGIDIFSCPNCVGSLTSFYVSAPYLVIDVLFTFQTVALTHLVTPVEGIPTIRYLVSCETLTGDEGTAPGEC